MSRRKVLFLCQQNSARSPMAEAWLRHLAPERFEAQSAGTSRRGSLHPLAVQVMAERDIDISGHIPKLVLGLMRERWAFAITVSDVNSAGPPFPAATVRLHWPFSNPTRATGTEQERLDAFRAVRDAIETRIQGWLSTEVP